MPLQREVAVEVARADVAAVLLRALPERHLAAGLLRAARDLPKGSQQKVSKMTKNDKNVKNYKNYKKIHNRSKSPGKTMPQHLRPNYPPTPQSQTTIEMKWVALCVYPWTRILPLFCKGLSEEENAGVL
jgi:hypothetical protein